MSNELLLGISDGGELTISAQEQLAHTFILAGANHTNSFIYEIISKKIEAGEGLILIQGERNSLRDSLLDKVKSSSRGADFIDIGSNTDFSDTRQIQDLMVKLITTNKIAYLSFSVHQQPTIHRIFMQALSGALDDIRTKYGDKHKQCNLITTNIENIPSKHWLKVINFSRLCNIALFNACGGMEVFQKLKINLDPMYNVVDELLNASLNKILFNQGDPDLNSELCRITGIRTYFLTRNGIYKNNQNKKVILEQLSGRKYILSFEGSVSLVSY